MNEEKLINYIKKTTRKNKNASLIFYFDIETYQYNENAGKVNPSSYKNMIYSFSVSWYDDDNNLEYAIFNHSYDFFNTVIFNLPKNSKANIELIAHNNNKYDNHFIRRELIYYYDCKIYNYYLMQSSKAGNENSHKIKDLTKEDKKACILEKRVKSKNNLEMIFYLYGIKFFTTDNYLKTNLSIKTLGEKLLYLGLVTENELKTDYDYLKYNKTNDLTDQQALMYSAKIFNNLSDDELLYIRNDVIILAKSVKYYSKLFNGFSYDVMTLTQNVLKHYNNNYLTGWQLLNRFYFNKQKIEINNTDYTFDDENFYLYLKRFYKGGLNFYNDKYVGKIINENCFTMDINSSYPYVMYNFKVPTFLSDFNSSKSMFKLTIDNNDDFFYLYKIDKGLFDIILSKINSIVVKKMLVKYYINETDFIYINSNTINILNDIFNLNIDTLYVYSYLKYECKYFASKDIISQLYYKKQQGKDKYKLDYIDPMNITKTNELNTHILSDEEIAHSKVLLNGLYGIPALRPYFNLFRLAGNDEYVNIENGFKNTERSIIFSIFVTSRALYTLLFPFKYLTSDDIDNNFLYCDTDSLYFKNKDNKILSKIPDEIFDDLALGKYGLDSKTISKFYALNHKKYCYLDKGKIKIKCGGIPLDSFNTDMDFEKFVKTQFYDGIEVKNNRSIMNKQKTISIYPSITKIEIGNKYLDKVSNTNYSELKKEMFEEIRKLDITDLEDALYIESNLGTFSLAEVFPLKLETNNNGLDNFLIRQQFIKNILVI